jgi:hypothetical protein
MNRIRIWQRKATSIFESVSTLNIKAANLDTITAERRCRSKNVAAFVELYKLLRWDIFE